MVIRMWNAKVDTETILQGTNAHVLKLVLRIQRQYVPILLDGRICVQNILKYLLR